MHDKGLIVGIFANIIWSLEQITKRFRTIKTSDDFLKDDEGIEKLDSICMQLITIGEALKRVDKLTGAKLLVKYPEVDWKKAKGMRDNIAHHYFDVDAEAVFVVCSEHIPEMARAIETILDDLKRS